MNRYVCRYVSFLYPVTITAGYVYAGFVCHPTSLLPSLRISFSPSQNIQFRGKTVLSSTSRRELFQSSFLNYNYILLKSHCQKQMQKNIKKVTCADPYIILPNPFIGQILNVSLPTICSSETQPTAVFLLSIETER